jgi:DNA modification methylase
MSVGQNIFEKNKIYHGDCLEVMKQISDKSINLVVTSPEYYGAPMWENKITYDDYLVFHEKVIDEAIRICVDGGFIIYNVSQMTVNSYPAKQTIGVYPIHLNIGNMMWSKGLTFREDIIWEKPDGYSNRFGVSVTHPYSKCYTPNQITEHILVFRKGKKKSISKELQIENALDVDYLKKFRSDIWRMNGKKDKEHPAPFPLGLVKPLVEFYSLKGDVILDPFAGSSTTAIACIETKRDWIMIEKEEQYYNLSLKRVGDFLNSFSQQTLFGDEE